MFGDIVRSVSEVSDAALDAELRSIEARRREDAAREAVVLAELERREIFRNDDHATMWGLLRSRLHWSDNDCRSGMRLARFVADHPDVGESLFEAWMSVANANELALAAVRVGLDKHDDPVAHREFGELVRLAQQFEHADLRGRIREWEQRMARRAATAEADDAHEHRSARVRVDAEGGEIVAQFGTLDAAEISEIFAHYVDAEWRTDWEAATAEHGGPVSAALLPRTDRQRRADAVKRIFRDAASTPAGSKAPEPVVNVHVDHATFTEILVEAELLPERTVDPFDDPTPHVAQRMARTQQGHALDHGTVLRLLLEGHLRMVVRDDEGVPIRWGRARRLFDGAARDAVRVLSTRCTHPGCRVPASVCETDHTIDWSKGGLTEPANGNPRCRRHNNTKNRGFTVWRDPGGQFHTYRPDGTEVS